MDFEIGQIVRTLSGGKNFRAGDSGRILKRSSANGRRWSYLVQFSIRKPNDGVKSYTEWVEEDCLQ